MKNLSIFARILVVAAGTAMVVSAVVLLVGERLLGQQARQSGSYLVAAKADRLGDTLAGVKSYQGTEIIAGTLRDFLQAHELAAVVVFSGDGRPIAALPPEAAETPPMSGKPVAGQGPLAVTIQGLPAQALFFPIEHAGPRFGGAWIAVSDRVVEGPVRAFRSTMTITGLIALTVSVLMASVAAGSVVRPIKSLTDMVARIGRGELDLRHPERGPKEIVRLARQVNRLTEKYDVAQAELSKTSAKVEGEVKGRTRYLQQTTQTMIDLASRDPLTGLGNRRKLEKELDHQIQLAKQTGNPLAVIMMDLDSFKKYNDTAGHLAGDKLLRNVADALRARTRATDLAVRWGGDEFCILLAFTPPDRALAAARSLIESVNQAAHSLPNAGVVGASAGVACFPDDAQGGTELIAAADAALYQVKESGGGDVLRL